MTEFRPNPGGQDGQRNINMRDSGTDGDERTPEHEGDARGDIIDTSTAGGHEAIEPTSTATPTIVDATPTETVTPTATDGIRGPASGAI